jgi:hypothetical protein
MASVGMKKIFSEQVNVVEKVSGGAFSRQGI